MPPTNNTWHIAVVHTDQARSLSIAEEIPTWLMMWPVGSKPLPPGCTKGTVAPVKDTPAGPDLIAVTLGAWYRMYPSESMTAK